jgi:hypothetical protein
MKKKQPPTGLVPVQRDRKTQKSGLSANRIARYLSEPGSSSNYLTMCEVSLSVTHTSVRCRACEGLGFRDLSKDELALRMQRIAREDDAQKRAELRDQLGHETTCRACRGSGYTTQKRADIAHAMDSMFTTVRCGRCKGCGEAMPPTDAGAERGDVCLKCVGETCLVPVTVKPKGSSKSGKAPRREAEDDELEAMPSRSVDEEALVERGLVARQLDALRHSDPLAAAAVESYFGLEGDRWGQHKWGRLFALWQHTSAGKQLSKESAERSRAGHGYLLAPLDLIAAERDAELRASVRSARRRALLARADVDARHLLRRMQAAIASLEAA